MSNEAQLISGAVTEAIGGPVGIATALRYRGKVNIPGQREPVEVGPFTPANRGNTGDLLIRAAKPGDPIIGVRVAGQMFLFVLTETLDFAPCPS